MSAVGLDLSLTASGLAIVKGDMESGAYGAACRRVRSKAPPTERGPKGKPLPPTLGQRRHRLHKLAHEIVDVVLPRNGGRLPGIVVIEQPAYSKTQGSQHDRSGLWWQVVEGLWERNVRVVEVSPTQVKKYATGKGAGVSKEEVMAAVIRRYQEVGVADDNEADALVLAAMGARFLGYPLEHSLPAKHLEAMGAVRWDG